MLDLSQELKSTVAALDRAGISYALCGGLALAIYGIPRATLDIDLLMLAENVDAAKQTLGKAGYRLPASVIHFAENRVLIHRLTKKDPVSEDYLSIDILEVTEALTQVWENRVSVTWEDGRLSTVSKQGLITLKTLRSSGQDRDDIRKLHEED